MSSSFIGRQDLPIGLRNNNPGDLRPGDEWQGMIGENGGFIVFSDISWGIRAMATDLLNKIKKGENTITAIVNVYAPASDSNDVPAYINAVAADTGLDPNQVIPLDTGTLHNLVRAFMNHELGSANSALITDADIDQGIAMVNNSLLSLVQATGIALQAAVNTATGNMPQPVDGSSVLIGVGVGLAAIAGLIFFTRKK